MKKIVDQSKENIAILDNKKLKEIIGGADRRVPNRPIKRFELLG